MVRACQITFADAISHNLYAMILATNSVTQLPQRTDLGAVIFPSVVSELTFLLPISEAGNSGQNCAIQDVTGAEINEVITGIPFTISDSVNSIDLQAILVQATASGVILDVSINAK